jgi:hypothetical protein
MAILMGYPRLQRNHALQKEVLIIQEKDTTVQQTMRSQAPCVSLVLSKQCEANPHAPSKTTHSDIVLKPLYKRHHMTCNSLYTLHDTVCVLYLYSTCSKYSN